jgi:hypothetical protein
MAAFLRGLTALRSTSSDTFFILLYLFSSKNCNDGDAEAMI